MNSNLINLTVQFPFLIQFYFLIFLIQLIPGLEVNIKRQELDINSNRPGLEL